MGTSAAKALVTDTFVDLRLKEGSKFENRKQRSCVELAVHYLVLIFFQGL